MFGVFALATVLVLRSPPSAMESCISVTLARTCFGAPLLGRTSPATIAAVEGQQSGPNASGFRSAVYPSYSSVLPAE